MANRELLLFLLLCSSFIQLSLEARNLGNGTCNDTHRYYSEYDDECFVKCPIGSPYTYKNEFVCYRACPNFIEDNYCVNECPAGKTLLSKKKCMGEYFYQSQIKLTVETKNANEKATFCNKDFKFLSGTLMIFGNQIIDDPCSYTFPNTGNHTVLIRYNETLKSMKEMFMNGIHMKKIDLSSMDSSKLEDMESAFYFTGLTEIDLSGFNTSKVKSMKKLFKNSPYLTKIIFSTKSGNTNRNLATNVFTTESTSDMSEMFFDTLKLASVDLSSLKFTKAIEKNQVEMFNDINKKVIFNPDDPEVRKVVGANRILTDKCTSRDDDYFILTYEGECIDYCPDGFILSSELYCVKDNYSWGEESEHSKNKGGRIAVIIIIVVIVIGFVIAILCYFFKFRKQAKERKEEKELQTKGEKGEVKVVTDIPNYGENQTTEGVLKEELDKEQTPENKEKPTEEKKEDKNTNELIDI